MKLRCISTVIEVGVLGTMLTCNRVATEASWVLGILKTAIKSRSVKEAAVMQNTRICDLHFHPRTLPSSQIL